MAHSLHDFGIELYARGGGDRPFKKRLSPIDGQLKLCAKRFQDRQEVIVVATSKKVAHDDRPVTRRLYCPAAKALERLDVCENLLSAGERLLRRVGERRHVAAFYAFLEYFELV
jgi:hypothetical protein